MVPAALTSEPCVPIINYVKFKNTCFYKDLTGSEPFHYESESSMIDGNTPCQMVKKKQGEIYGKVSGQPGASHVILSFPLEGSHKNLAVKKPKRRGKA